MCSLHCTSKHTHSLYTDFNTRVTSITSSSTALFYKDLEGTETPPEEAQPTTEEFFMRSNKKRHNKLLHKKQQQQSVSSYTTTTTTTPSTTEATTTTTSNNNNNKKKKKKKLKNKQQRSYTIHKRAKGGGSSGPVATREELASHVQAVFSDLKEYEQHGSGGASMGDGDLEDQFDEDGRSSSSGSSSQDKGVMKQNSLLLDKHPSLVLNADYQPLRMLPLSTWSWQTTVKAVLSGKAVVVDVYPDLYVRAVSLDIPVPSVIALREYAPTGKAVSVCVNVLHWSGEIECVIECACVSWHLPYLLVSCSCTHDVVSSLCLALNACDTETSIHPPQRLPP